MPLYWRRFWVDAITVGCLKHSLWLVPIDTLTFLKSTNWLDVESQILISARQAVGEFNLRASSHFTRCISKGALHAQSLFNFGHDENAILLRYGYVKVLEARQVANDLLDVLLIAESSTASSLLSAYVFLLNISLPSGAVSVPRRNGRVMCIRRVKTLDARIFALTMVDTLMAASYSTNTQKLPHEGVGAFAMRTHWLWTLMPQESLDLLMQRVKLWPTHYVRACWPELENLEHYPMLHRKKFLIKESVRLANRHLLGTSLANIRSH